MLSCPFRSSGWMSTRTVKIDSSRQKVCLISSSLSCRLMADHAAVASNRLLVGCQDTVSKPRDRGQCPICNKDFDVDLLERHAAQCGEDDEDMEDQNVHPRCAPVIIDVDAPSPQKKSKKGQDRRDRVCEVIKLSLSPSDPVVFCAGETRP